VNVSGKFLVAALRSAYAEATTVPAVALRAKLLEKSSLSFASVASGSVKSISGNGHTVTLAHSSEGVTPTDITEVWSYLIELFDRAYAELTGTPNDAQVEAKMETYMRDVRGYTHDWRYLEK
jgi:hypothetical protein